MSASRDVVEDLLGHPLSDPQWAAVSAPLVPAAIVAGAGSGKTTVMAARVAWLVIEDLAAPDAILGLTFTTKAAAELLGRTRRLLVSAQRQGLVSDDLVIEPAVSTYHSFAARLLADHGVRVGLEPGADVLADGARQALAAHVVRGTALPLAGLDRTPAGLISAVLALDDTLAELDLAPDTVLDDAVDLIGDLQSLPRLQAIGERMLETARIRAALCGLVEEFRDAKLERRVVDFADQVRWALAIVRGAAEVRTDLRAHYRCVLLDEYQDTSVAQRLLLQSAFGDGHPVTAVGDPCQAIYEWRGASVDNIDRFPEHFPIVRAGVITPAQRYPLADNRRSGPRILDLANRLAEPLRALHPGVEPLMAAAEGRGQGEVRCALLRTAAEEHVWVADEVERLRERSGGWEGIAVLARKGETLVDIDRVLRERGVPTHLVGLAGLLDVPVVAEVRAILEVLADPTANAACIRLLAGPRWRLGVRDLAALGRLAGGLVDRPGTREPDLDSQLRSAVLGSDAADVVSLVEAIDRVAAGEGEGLAVEAIERLGSLSAELALLRQHRDDAPVELIARILRVTGLGVEMAVGPAAEVADRARAMSAFRDLAARFSPGVGATRPTLEGFLARLRDAEAFDAAPTLDDIPTGDAVILMTAHRAKGLEFPHVIVPAMCEGVFPSARGRDRWPTNPAVVPWHLRDDAPAGLLGFPDRVDGPTATSHRAFADASAVVAEAEERRLAYVAVTRAERSLSVSAHWWGPTQVRPRGPSAYLREIHDWCLDGGGEIVHWASPPPDGEVNPLAEERAFTWPRAADPVAHQARVAAAAMVRAAQAGSLHAPTLTPDEARIADTWDVAAASLLAEARSARAPRTVELPASLSASALVRLHDDPEAFALELARPMPRRPSRAARRGTAVHAWIEGQYAVQTLFDLDELEGADDAVVDAEQQQLREAFLRTPYAARAPVAVEAPFAVLIAGRIIRGRIDAVFGAPGGRTEVVDWKTGGRGGLRDLQLAIYRIAWAEMTGVPVEDVDASFVIVPTGEVVRPTDLPGRMELERILSAP